VKYRAFLSIFGNVDNETQRSRTASIAEKSKAPYPKTHQQFDDLEILKNILHTIDPESFTSANHHYKYEPLWNENCAKSKPQDSQGVREARLDP
jgi:hypothetical protein